jgi:hypothetical protein
MTQIRQQRRWIGGGVLLLVLLWLPWMHTHAAPPSQGGDTPILGGRFFPQTANGQGGFSVVNDNEARFWAEYQRLGGSQTVGFPISRRFVYDGFVTQAFQKLVLQWRPEIGNAYPINVFDELSEAGHDESLLETRQTPYPLLDFDQPSWTFPQIIANRQALLNENPALRARYFSVSDPLNVFGLPTSRVEDMGNHYAIRTQRAVFQQWKESVPWASAGQVTIANGGSIAQELEWLPADALIPESVSGAPAPTVSPTALPVAAWEPEVLLVGPGQTGTLWLMEFRQRVTGSERRLLISGNRGGTWSEFSGGLPDSDCIYQVTLDYNTPNLLYVATCDGLFTWDGAEWVTLSEAPIYAIAIQFGEPQTWWAIRPKENGGAQLSRSDDGGQTWRRLTVFALGAENLIVDSSTQGTLYALRTEYGSTGGAKLVRMDSQRESNPILINVGYESNLFNRRPTALTIDGSTGDVYVATDWNGTVPVRVWHSQNADDLTIANVFWEEQSERVPGNSVVHLAGGRDANDRFVLYAIHANVPVPNSGAAYSLSQSFDQGQTWQEMTIPR